MTSRITFADVMVDAVVASWRALPGYRAPTDSTSGVTVFDGPEVLLSSEAPSSYVIVGYGGEDDMDAGDSSDDMLTSDVSVRALATTSPKEEDGQVECLAVYQSGDEDVSAARSAVVTIGSAVDAALRSAPQLGLIPDGTQLLWTQVTGVALRTYLRGGVVAKLRFTLSYKART